MSHPEPADVHNGGVLRYFLLQTAIFQPFVEARFCQAIKLIAFPVFVFVKRNEFRSGITDGLGTFRGQVAKRKTEVPINPNFSNQVAYFYLQCNSLGRGIPLSPKTVPLVN